MSRPVVGRSGQDTTQTPDAAGPSWRSRAARWVALAGLLVPTGIIEDRQPGAVAEDPFTPTTLLRGIAPAVCLLVALLLSRTSWRPRGRRETLLAGYLAVVVASAAWSLAPVLTLLKAGHLVVAWALLVVAARQWPDARAALRDVAVVAQLVVVLAALGALVDPDTAFRAGSDGRLFAVFPALQPVVLGMVSTVAVLTLVGGAGARVVRETLPLRLALLAVSVGVLLLTRTRSALALVVLGLVLLAWFHGRRRLAAAVVLVGAAGLAFLLSGAGRGLTEVLAGGSSRFSAASFGGRFPLWADALRVVEDRPLVGYGYFAGHRFGEYAERFTVTTGRSDPYVDGTWVETALDLGLLGVVALAAFVLWSARAAWRSDGPRALHRTLLVVLLLYSVQDFTVQQPGFPMFLLGGLLLAGRGRQATANTAARPPMNARA